MRIYAYADRAKNISQSSQTLSESIVLAADDDVEVVFACPESVRRRLSVAR